jgi:hypothetical protein
MKIIPSIFGLALILSPIALHASDPFLGRWVLDGKQSKYPAGSCPKLMTIEMSAVGRGIHYHSETQLANGRSFEADYTAEYDGKPVMVGGDRGMLLPVALKRVGHSDVVATYSRGFQVLATSRRAVSRDGKTMTVTTTSQDGSGKSVTNVGVYRKADPTTEFDLARIRSNLHIPQ